MDISTIFCTFLLWHLASCKSATTLNIYTNKSYTATWAVELHSSAVDNDAHFLAKTLGLTYQKILPDKYYLLFDEYNRNVSDAPNKEMTEALKSFSKVIWVEQQVAQRYEFRTGFSDPLWSTQNHLMSSSSGFKISHHVEDVWAKGYTGKGVTVAVIDDGVRGTHHELKQRYDQNASFTIANRPSTTSGHGTKCAGVIAAEANNSICGVGVAYSCKIAGIKLFASKSATDAEEAQAFYRDGVDIFSNSWGPSDDGYTIAGPGRLAGEALRLGSQKGRRGLGSIYVFSCGNGVHLDDSCAFDGYVNSIYTIPVASITKDGKVTGFSEPCSAIMTAVYSSKMVTVSNDDDRSCVTDFSRTSAAAAFVSGILALALEANGNLTWRDMQHLIARSSNWNNVDPAVKRVTNAKGYTVNGNFGFGVLDASTLIDNAKKWNTTVQRQVTCSLNITKELGYQTLPTLLNVNITKDNLKCESTMIKSLEHVQLRVHLDYTNRAVLIIDVNSMSGTSSRYLYPRSFDGITSPRTYDNLVITSVHFWGEPLLGKWTVDVKEGNGIHEIHGSGTLLNMSLIFYGTSEIVPDNDKRTVAPTTHKTTSKPDPPPCQLISCIVPIVVVTSCLCATGAFVTYKMKRRLQGSRQNDVSERDGQELSMKKSSLPSSQTNKVMV